MKSLKKNYIYNLLYQILTAILPIITAPYIARVLGAGGNGIYSYTISIVTYFILFGSAGINLYGQREIAYVQDDRKKRDKVFSELFTLKTIIMTISTIAFWFLFADSGEYSVYYKILIFEIIANIIDISWVYQGLEEFKKIVTRNTVIRLISTILTFILVHNDNDLWIYITIYAVTNLLGNLSLWFRYKQYITFKITGINLRQHIKPIITLFIPQVAIQIYVLLDKTMLGSILNNMDEVGYYDQSQKIIKTLLTLITSMGTVMLPRIAKTFADKNHAKIKDYMYKTFNYVYMFSIPLMFGLIAVSHNFVPVFLGPGYEEAISVINIMSVIILFISLSNIIGIQYLLPTKRQKEYTISVVAGALVNLSLNFALIPIFRAIGATIATVAAEFTVTIIQFYSVRKDFKISDILRMSSKYFIASILMFLICSAVGIIIKDDISSLFAQTTIGFISYFFILIALKNTFILDILSKYTPKYIKPTKNKPPQS